MPAASKTARMESGSEYRLPTSGGLDTPAGTRKAEIPYDGGQVNSCPPFVLDPQPSSFAVSQAERGVLEPDADVFEPENPTAESRNEPNSLKLEIRGVTSHKVQAVMWEKEIVFQQSVLAKLKFVGKGHLAGKMAECHTIKTFKRCNGCRKVTHFFNRCELFFCPVCAARLSRERKESIEWWTKQIAQPKHVVLTVRNTSDLTKLYIQWLKGQLGKLRRSKVMDPVKGGFYSMEVTNEGRGWHVHFHLLCDAKWIDSGELARTWAKLVGQNFAIVKVKDCRGAQYLQEVTKYAVKGSELAKWNAAQIATFITAFEGVRFFGVFGSLYGKRTEWKEWIESVRDIKPLCSCGCDSWRLLSPEELLWEEETRAGLTGEPPPAKTQIPKSQIDLALGARPGFTWSDKPL